MTKLNLQSWFISLLFSLYMGCMAGLYGVSITGWHFWAFFALPSLLAGMVSTRVKQVITNGFWVARDGTEFEIYAIKYRKDDPYQVHGCNGFGENFTWDKCGYFICSQAEHKFDLIRKVKQHG